MNNQELQVFLNIIDNRIKKYINNNKLLKQYCGVIIQEIQDSLGAKYVTRLLGSDTEFIFLNKSGEVLTVGDYVYIQTVGTDLNTGVIVYKIGETQPTISESGKKDGWEYIKWSNGMVDFWGQVIFNGSSDSSLPDVLHRKFSVATLGLTNIGIINTSLIDERGHSYTPDVFFSARGINNQEFYIVASRQPRDCTVSGIDQTGYTLNVTGKGRWKE